jgi:pSer/pThr/pTyr-binding forkhead associated (FHA) protein
MICVIDVVAGPAKGKRVWIREDGQLQIGRHSAAELSIPSDPHLSRRHVLIEGTSGKFRARDLGSANGTFVNRAEITATELFDGDQIQAGTTMLAVAFLPDGTNPHGSDGVLFGKQPPAFEQLPVEEESTKRFQMTQQVPTPAMDQSKITPSGTHFS